MSEERKKILEMLKNGKLTLEEADQLLDKLEAMDHAGSPGEPGRGYAVAVAPQLQDNKKTNGKRFLAIRIHTHDGKKINLRFPLWLAKAGVRLSGMMPDHANEKLREKGIDLDAFGDLEKEELDQALQEIDIDINTEEGDSIRIQSE
jgi:predicted HTH domain antitoxin